MLCYVNSYIFDYILCEQLYISFFVYCIILRHFVFLFDIYDASDELMFKVQNKMAILGTITGAAPTAVAGGIYYSGSDQWFLGYETAPS